MTRKDIIKEMEVRGYKAVEREIVKNGVVFEAICVQLDKQAGVLLDRTCRKNEPEHRRNR